MATVYAGADGSILSVFDNYQVLYCYAPIAPVPGTVTTLDFDETVFPALLADLKMSTGSYSLTGGTTPVLTKAGASVAVTNIPGASIAWQTACGLVGKVTPDMLRQALTMLYNGTATLAQAEKAIFYILVKLVERDMLI